MALRTTRPEVLPVVDAVLSGNSVGVGAVVEVTFEAEEMLFVEVVGEIGGDEAEEEDEEAGDDDFDAFVGG